VESDAELFPYRGAELKRLQQRLDDLNNGRDVLVYLHEIPRAMQPARDGHTIVYTLRGGTLVTAEYEHASAPLVYDDSRW
jgi:hypothetical protein